MEINQRYFEVLEKEKEIPFFHDDDFVAEFIKQCNKRGLKVKKVLYKGYLKIVKKANYRFYVQMNDFDYATRNWSWKLYSKAESYEEALKIVGGSLYNNAGDKMFRVFDRDKKIYY